MLDKVLLAKLGVCAACTLGAFILVPLKRFQTIPDRRFKLEMTALLLTLRAACFISVFIAAGFSATSDLLVYYENTKHALQGQLPYRDFTTAYGPLFNYTGTLALRLWDSPKSLILLAIVFEAASLPLWMAAASRLFTQPIYRTATLLYVTSPLTMMVVAINGQNHVWIAFFLAASVLLLLRRRDLASGLALGASVVVVKFLSLLFAPCLFLAASHRLRWAAGAAALPVVLYGLLAYNGIDITEQVKFHAQHGSSGNLPFLLSAFGLDFSSPRFRTAANAIGLAVILSVIALPRLKHLDYRGPNTIHLISMLTLTLLLVSKKSFSSYLVISFFALCCSLAPAKPTRKSVLLFSLFGTLAVLEPSLWFRWLNQHDLRLLWQDTLPDGIHRSNVVVFLLWEIALLATYAIALKHVCRALQTHPQKTTPSSDSISPAAPADNSAPPPP